MKDRRPRGAQKSEPKAQQDDAARLAIQALAFIAGEPERLGRFLALSGIGPESIRAAASSPDFLLGVLDHVAGDETLLVEFANASEIDPQDIVRARDVLADEGKD